jgi:hypothetical protein
MIEASLNFLHVATLLHFSATYIFEIEKNQSKDSMLPIPICQFLTVKIAEEIEMGNANKQRQSDQRWKG